MTTREKLDCQEVQALAGAYALDAVTPLEAAAIREHLETCAGCRADVAQMVEVARALPLSVEATPPPAGLKQRILDAIAEDPADAAIVSLPGSMGAPEQTPRRSFWSSRAWPVLAAAALVAAVSVAGYAYNLQQAQPRVYTLHSTAAPTATGQLTYFPREHAAYLTLDKMPTAAAGRTYQMWLIRNGKPESVGTMQPDAAGEADVTLNKDLGGYQQFAVTDEPDGGSAQPTGAQVLSQGL
ncbi:MAG TPA: anti-sigma factor [Candidatus Dormibacteraeota bacterium]|nr:anti-sigma factor [Candidatus Dormibacteraeota bacterium]